MGMPTCVFILLEVLNALWDEISIIDEEVQTEGWRLWNKCLKRAWAPDLCWLPHGLKSTDVWSLQVLTTDGLSSVISCPYCSLHFQVMFSSLFLDAVKPVSMGHLHRLSSLIGPLLHSSHSWLLHVPRLFQFSLSKKPPWQSYFNAALLCQFPLSPHPIFPFRVLNRV